MKLEIKYEGDPILRLQSLPVEKITRKTRKLIDDMFDTMWGSNGIGLAASQVGVNVRAIIIDIQTERSKPFALINPEIVSSEGEQLYEEGCLSCPGLAGVVRRAALVTVTGLDPKGNNVQIDADNLLAVVLQHEIDHLNGVLFVDRLEPDERLKVERQRSQLRM